MGDGTFSASKTEEFKQPAITSTFLQVLPSPRWPTALPSPALLTPPLSSWSCPIQTGSPRFPSELLPSPAFSITSAPSPSLTEYSVTSPPPYTSAPLTPPQAYLDFLSSMTSKRRTITLQPGKPIRTCIHFKRIKLQKVPRRTRHTSRRSTELKLDDSFVGVKPDPDAPTVDRPTMLREVGERSDMPGK